MTAEDRYLNKIAGRLDRTREEKVPSMLSRPVLRVPVRILDRFLGGLRPGTVTLLDSGHLYVYDLVGMLCVQSVGELCGDVLYIDGGNTFDPYGLLVHARRMGVDRELVLDNIKVARAFTAYQMTSLLHDMLGKELERHARDSTGRPMTVIVANMPDLYLDDDVNRTEAVGMVDLCTRRLLELTEERSVVTVVSNHGLSKLGKGRMRELVYKRTHRVVRIERPSRDAALPEGRGWHPAFSRSRKAHTQMLISLPFERRAMCFCPAPRYQRTLDDFGDIGILGPGPEGV